MGINPVRLSRWGLALPTAAAVGGFLLVTLYPYLALVEISLSDQTGSSFRHYVAVFQSDYLLFKPLRNSLLVSTATATAATTIGTGLAWLAARTDLPGKRWLGALVAIPHIIPSFQLASSWVVLFGSGGIYQSMTGFASPFSTYGVAPLITVQSVHLTLYSYLTAIGALSSLDPSLEEAAQTAGLRRVQILRRITFPLVLPAILSGLLLTFANAMAEFGAPALLGTPVGFNTLTTQIYELSTAPPLQFGQAGVLSLLLGAIALAVTLLNLRLLARGSYVTVTGKAAAGEILKLGRWRWTAGSLAWAYAAVTSLVPLFALIMISLLKSWGRGFGVGNLTLQHYAGLLQSDTLSNALWNTLALGFGTAAIAMALSFIIAYGAIRLKARWGMFADRVSFITFSTPGLVLGIAFVIAFSQPPVNLFGTDWLLLAAYCAHFTGLGVRSAAVGLAQLSAELEEAGAVSGLSRASVLWKITLPLMKGSMAAGFLLVFVNVVKEISATSLLVSQGTETLAYAAFLHYIAGDYTIGSAVSVVMIALALAGSVIISRWSRLGSSELIR